MDWKWLLGFATPLIIALVIAFYKVFERLTKLEGKKIDVEIIERLVKLETDTTFATKVIWEFLIAKVHNDEDEFGIDDLLDKWKNHKLKKAEDIQILVNGLHKVISRERDNSKRAAAALLLKMLDKGIGITTKL